MTLPDKWLQVTGVVQRGHGVASGRGPNSPYPISSLRMQAPFFKARGPNSASTLLTFCRSPRVSVTLGASVDEF